MTVDIFMSSRQPHKIKFMRYKRIILIAYCSIIVLLASCSSNRHLVVTTTGLNLDPNIYGEPRLDLVERIYDNLSENKLPKFLLEYYQDLAPNCYYSIEFRVDTTKISSNGYYTTLFMFTKLAKDGYLLINKTFSDKIKECCANSNDVQISYVYNGKAVSTKDEVRQILKLRAKKVQILSVEQDESTKVVAISFTDK